MKVTRPVTVALFSGGGGLDLGFAAAGYEISACVDIDPYSCKTIELNSPKRRYLGHPSVLRRDICGLSGQEIVRQSGLRGKRINMLIGGPPCQAFSVFGRRGGRKDSRSRLIWEYLRLVRELEPEAFLLENVQGLKTIHNGELYDQLIRELSINGKYSVSDHEYELAQFGIPQFRRRLFFLGSKNGNHVPPMRPTHGPSDLLDGLLPHVPAGRALRGMPQPGKNAPLPNHVGRVHSRRIINRYNNLKFGERDSATRVNRLAPNRPSFTIIVGSDAGGGKGHIHPFSPREVTPRESARLQTFPDWWEFHGTGRHVIRQVGNAVPPLFAAILAQHVAKHVFAKKPCLKYEKLLDKLGLEFLK